ncbi:hypothetical protein A1F94_009689 [Pyrenophora tritici-repentis]|uniref:Uncharacterized protein n=1 Tax=Pyrenophora tritici-repentis (strain Pt-1C-BFP) TaxID=426418 RepID=B2WF87_PYRTR|nr:uncharacterized protein PTRG_08248 [Pyrenophora tritici-repentis Pt-1C-BFP]KAG9379333.1 hypothetical protein A1F94_009689 [Pyrenophora tritici-repentis]EDU51167.1 predicted protein [Pyrenophora tritici-repentis Pt-1C-BFP]KAI1560937.1 hypothetical protein PtrEW7m1_011391 [Pyrenophora tritici-repentis]KAI1571612.1 hypothetical protein PtrEW13061_011358 [Pyrenophora tritici-repentis]KAI1665942.1 hypothetical protein L13192_09626 [Pyrenophora tritici-repentis]
MMYDDFEQLLDLKVRATFRKSRGEWNEADDEWRMAKALILYTTREGALVSLEFVSDTQEERDVGWYIEKLRREIPAKNLGVPPYVQLQMLRDAEVSAFNAEL